jgi:large subunit ribosomal protein L24
MFTPSKKKGPRATKPKIEGKLQLHVGDLVRVIAGKDKGKEGKIARVIPSEGKVVIEGINIVVKHQKARQQAQQSVIGAPSPQSQGGRIEQASPLAASKVQLVDPADNKKVTRIGVRMEADGTRVRVARKSGSVIDNG